MAFYAMDNNKKNICMANIKKQEKTNKKYEEFVSTNKIVQPIAPNPTQNKMGGSSIVRWGDDDKYPNYLHNLYYNAPTLYAIINSVVDYTIGEGVENDTPIFEKKDADELIRNMALSYALYGGIALQVTRSIQGNVADVDVLDLRCLRTNEQNTKFWYSKKYKEENYYSYGTGKELPKFEKEGKDIVSIYYWKNNRFATYPSPLYAAAVNSAQCEKEVQTYNLASVKNGFNPTHFVQFFKGLPDDDTQRQIEQNFTNKFNGAANAGGVIISYNDSKEEAATITTLEQTNFADKYAALNDRVKQDLFTAFRCHPNIMGIPSEGTGFAGEEYEQTFKLFNKMTIKPIQNIIKSILKDVLDIEIEIIPFNLN